MSDNEILAGIKSLREAVSTGNEKLAARLAILEGSEFETRVKALELARAEGADRVPAIFCGPSLGSLVAEDEAAKAYIAGKSKELTLQVKGSLRSLFTKNTILGNVTGSGGPLATTQTVAGIVPGASEKLDILTALAPVTYTTTADLIKYVRELSFTNNAAETSEGEAKPESAITFEDAETPTRTIATWLRTSLQSIRNTANGLAQFLDSRMRYAVLKRLGGQIVAGDGAGANLAGMTAAGNHSTFVPATGDSEIDSINRALGELETSGYEADYIILHPRTWRRLQRIRAGSDGDYVAAQVGALLATRAQKTIWDVPVITSTAITEPSFIVFSLAAVALFERDAAKVEVFREDSDNVTKNLVTVLAEGDYSFIVTVPGAVLYGPLTQS